MLRVLFSARMLAFHALVLLIVPSFVALGFWQLDRWEEKSARAELQERNMAAEPVAARELTEVGGDVAPDDQWRAVTARGTYDPDHELLVRNRDGPGGVGLHVLTPLVTEDGTAVLVNRGWIEQPPTARSQPDVPPPPTGDVTVTGRMRHRETAENTGIRERGGLPEGQIMLIDTDEIGRDLPYPVHGGYVELTDQDPASDPAPEPVEPPETNTGMNLSYAVQWWVFTGIAVVGWGFLMRRELRDAQARGDSPGPGDPAPAPDHPGEPSGADPDQRSRAGS